MISFHEHLDRGGPYQGYVYGYPHKTAYRKLEPVVALADAWRLEDKSALYLYLHIPFCEMRCGFCNLFTTTESSHDFIDGHFEALRRQAIATLQALGPKTRFARIAIGGGTPTILSPNSLQKLLEFVVEISMDSKVPFGVEVSPTTVTHEKLAMLKNAGVTRVSMGVQSFDANETRALGRLQHVRDVEQSLKLIAEAGFHTTNIDLTYGIAGQTRESWLGSLSRALAFEPDELYLYPLYVRPLTLLARNIEANRTDNLCLELYRSGREHLLERGYQQISMRLFRKGRAAEGPVYCCQEDGMVGLGAGARSYTSDLHYSTEWAVSYGGVKGIIRDYIAAPCDRFRFADYGVCLSLVEQKRRYIIKSLLRADGLNLRSYLQRFEMEAALDFSGLGELISFGALEKAGDFLKPTPLGLELSDAIGPWFYSTEITNQMNQFVLT